MILEEGYVDFENEPNEEDEAFEGLDVERRAYRYYESRKTLGYLHRDIDERRFLVKMQEQHRLALDAPAQSQNVMERLLGYIKQQAANYGLLYSHHESLGREIRASYEESLLDILYYYEPTPRSPVSEAEAFAGTILGRQGGAQGKPLRELSKTMREHFEAVVEYAIMRIVKGDQAMQAVEDLDDLYDEREFEALPRAIACLSVAVEEPGWKDRQVGELKSFKYVAAGVCLRELARYRITTFGLYTLPRVQ